jgi:hypothetical protein
MWPRNDIGPGPGQDMIAARRSKNAGLSGFVSFMKRRDAEEALREFDGLEWGGSVLRVGWSKAVPIAPKPLYGEKSSFFLVIELSLPSTLVSSMTKSRESRSRSRSPRGYRRSRHSRSRSYSRSRSRSRSPRHGHNYHRDSRSRSPRRRRSRSRSRSPVIAEEEVTDTFIRTVAAEVKGQGEQFETHLLEQEQDNAKYGFLHPQVRLRSFHRSQVLSDMQHKRYTFYRNSIKNATGPEFDDDVSSIVQCYPLLIQPPRVIIRSIRQIPEKNRSESAVRGLFSVDLPAVALKPCFVAYPVRRERLHGVWRSA